MNGLNKILDRISAEAQAEVNVILAEAADKCREIKAGYDQKAQDEYWRLVGEGSSECETQVRRLAGAAEMEAKKAILATKQEAVTRVLEASKQRICTMPEGQYVSFLARLASDASFTGTEEIILNEKDKNTVGKAVVREANELLRKRKLQQSITLSSGTGDFMGGLMLKQGDIEVNCTVETLVELSREKLASQIAEILFAD